MADQIIVNSSPTQVQVEAGLRQLLLALIPLATGLGLTRTAGYLSVALGAVGTIATVVIFVWGQIITRTKAKQAVTMAAALPDSIATTK